MRTATTATTATTISIVGLLALLLSLGSIGQPARGDESAKPPEALDPIRLKAIPDRLAQFVTSKDIAGIVTLVATRDGVVELDALGQSDIAAAKPMKTDNLFWIASMTKPITATAIMMLQDEGKLSVDDPVGKYLPELANLKTADGKAQVVTIKHLLTHTSGMGEATPEQSNAARQLADLIPHFAEHPLGFVPGSQWRHCQSGINSLGRIIEVVSGQSLPDFFKKRLFDPLGMKDTTFYLNDDQAARLAKSYKLEDGQLIELPVGIFNGHAPTSTDHFPAANGGLFTTATDYSIFLRMVLNRGSLNGVQFLKPATVEQMTTVQSGDVKAGFVPGSGWGLGWGIVREPQGATAVLSHGSCGHGGAFGTQGWIDPERGLALVMMVQRSNFPNGDASDERRIFQEAAIAAYRSHGPNKPSADGSIQMHARDAFVHGLTARYEPSPHKNTIGYWTNPADWVSWNFTVATAGKYKVTTIHGCGPGSGGAEVEFAVGEQKLNITVPETGGFQNWQTRDIGEINLPAGEQTLTVKALKKPGLAVMDLQQVILTPAR